MMAFRVSREHRPDASGNIHQLACADALPRNASAIDVFVFSDWTAMGAGGKILSIPSPTSVMASMKPGQPDEHHHFPSARVVHERCFGRHLHVFAR